MDKPIQDRVKECVNIMKKLQGPCEYKLFANWNDPGQLSPDILEWGFTDGLVGKDFYLSIFGCLIEFLI